MATGSGPPDERALVAEAQRGDRDALERLLRSNYDRIYAVCRRIAGNEADALDATQEAMIAIVKGLPRFDGRSAFSTWCYRIATNACLDELRRRSRRPRLVIDAGPDHESEPAGGGPPLADQVSDRLDIDAALGLLPEDFRAAVVLRDVLRLDYAEIAEVLGIPPGTVRSRIARGRAGLRRALTGNPAPSADRPTTRS